MDKQKYLIVDDDKKTRITDCFIDTLAVAVDMLKQGKAIAIKPIDERITHE